MKAMAQEKGLLAGFLPYVRLGNGTRRLVIFPGLADAAWDVTAQAWDFPARYRRFTDQFTVYVISRKRGLARGYATRDMAHDYAKAFENEIGPAVVMGISLGGYIAQHLAADFPHYVQRLVIVCAGHHVSDRGREIPERWLTLARENRWREFYCDIAKITMAEYPRTFYRFLVPLLRMRLSGVSDFLVSLKACLGHDSSKLLRRIGAPTLIVGGTEDVFFPPALLRETALGIPNATLRFLDGCRHGAYELRQDEFELAVTDFLHDGDSVALSSSALVTA